MKKKIMVSVAAMAVLLMGLATVAFAADNWKTPAEIVAGLTGKTVNQTLVDRQAGEAYGAQAAQSGKLDEFQAERLAQCKQRLDDAVKAGQLTQAEADQLYAAMKTRMESCIGTGHVAGNGNGNGFGYGTGMGRGCGMGYGRGRGLGSN